MRLGESAVALDGGTMPLRFAERSRPQRRRVGLRANMTNMTIASVLAVMLVVTGFAVAHAVFTSKTNSAGTFTAASSFPNYPTTVNNDLPSLYHRLDEAVSSSATPTTPDASV